MNTYDVRKQIQKENKNKLIGEIGMVLFLLVILCCIVFVGRLSNPFHVLDSKNGKDLVKEYEAGTDYVKVSNATLEFTGYYKEDKNNNILYNCYATVIGDEKFFVFVPAERSGNDPKDPDETLTNYSFTARMHKDSDLLSVVAKDYELTVDEWIDSGVISTIVLDEADLDLTRMYIIWLALMCVILLCILYCIISFVHLKSIYKRKEITELQKYGPIDDVLDSINEEVENHLVYDSIALKITEQYFLGFGAGKVYIRKREQITKVLITSKIKKAYGIVKLGYENFLQIYEGEQVAFELPMENEIEAKEILEVMTDEELDEESKSTNEKEETDVESKSTEETKELEVESKSNEKEADVETKSTDQKEEIEVESGLSDEGRKKIESESTIEKEELKTENKKQKKKV